MNLPKTFFLHKFIIFCTYLHQIKKRENFHNWHFILLINFLLKTNNQQKTKLKICCAKWFKSFMIVDELFESNRLHFGYWRLSKQNAKAFLQRYSLLWVFIVGAEASWMTRNRWQTIGTCSLFRIQVKLAFILCFLKMGYIKSLPLACTLFRLFRSSSASNTFSI